LVRREGEGLGQDPGEEQHGRQLGRPGEEGDHRGGSAFVDVGRPHVEGGRRDLESQTADHEDQAEEDAGAGLPLHRRRNGVEADGAGEAVDQGGAVEQQARGQGAEHEVLQAGLGGLRIIPLKGGHDIERQGLELDPDVEAEEVPCPGHHTHAEGRQQDQDRKLEVADAAPLEPGLAEGNDDHAPETDHHLGEDRGGVRRQGA